MFGCYFYCWLVVYNSHRSCFDFAVSLVLDKLCARANCLTLVAAAAAPLTHSMEEIRLIFLQTFGQFNNNQTIVRHSNGLFDDSWSSSSKELNNNVRATHSVDLSKA